MPGVLRLNYGICGRLRPCRHALLPTAAAGARRLDAGGEARIGASDCERIRDGRLAQPVNALTSLAYVGAAGAVLARAWGRTPGRRAEVLGFAGLLVLVGAGSVAFHGPQPPGAKHMHDWPIPGLLVVVAATPLARCGRGLDAAPGWSRRRGAALAGVASAAGLAYAGGRTSAPTCDPDSPLQLHGAWHVLSAVAFAMVAGILYDPESGA